VTAPTAPELDLLDSVVALIRTHHLPYTSLAVHPTWDGNVIHVDPGSISALWVWARALGCTASMTDQFVFARSLAMPDVLVSVRRIYRDPELTGARS
jgi:hypothetical protein